AVLQRTTGAELPVGMIDVSRYRDDVTRDAATRVVDSSQIGFAVSGRTVILVDDVLCTGRTARAALDALVDRGRPSRVQLAVLVDRGHRELPIRPDYVGKNQPTSRTQEVRVQLREIDGVDGVLLLSGKEE
ncbi:MAG: bifunctional pyr operon transcriptional regulator/uracil phosphoribosyltransferase PyrR, partial [Chloroflexota bacterium]|nr:bifunctional pyr operon transcriptional regulator/uracil phosphoribosyltransferase PyrR [Chloroflexota bacterium]